MAIAEAELQADIRPGMEITEDELMRLPRDGRKWELVDGRLTEVPTSIVHEEIIFNLIVLLTPFVRGHGIVTLGARRVPHDQRQCPRPGRLLHPEGAIPRRHAPDTFGDLAPDLCVEIISPSEKRADIDRKMREYFDNGAQFVWHVFPERQQVIVFTSPTKTQALSAEDALAAGDLLPGFSCRVGDLFI